MVDPCVSSVGGVPNSRLRAKLNNRFLDSAQLQNYPISPCCWWCCCFCERFRHTSVQVVQMGPSLFAEWQFTERVCIWGTRTDVLRHGRAILHLIGPSIKEHLPSGTSYQCSFMVKELSQSLHSLFLSFFYFAFIIQFFPSFCLSDSGFLFRLKWVKMQSKPKAELMEGIGFAQGSSPGI